MDKLIQPNILILLAEKKLHGYLIIQELDNKHFFQGEKADNTGVYRALKILESKGLVNFEWDFEGDGAAKKIYKITEAGRECLQNWILTLENYKKTIERMIKDAKSVI